MSVVIHLHARNGHRRVFVEGGRAFTGDDFKEEEHPRKDDGKFAPKGEGEAPKASTSKAAPTLTPHMKDTLKAKGFTATKQKAKNGATIYEHPSGVKIHASGHNPEGKATSSLWESNLAGKEAKRGIGSKELDKLLNRGEAPAPKPAAKAPSAPPPPSSKAGISIQAQEVMTKHGFKPSGNHEYGGTTWQLFTKGKTTVALGEGAWKGKWVSASPGNQTKMGANSPQLSQLLGGTPAGTNIGSAATIESGIAKHVGGAGSVSAASSLADPHGLLGSMGANYQAAAAGQKPPTPEQLNAITSYTGAGYQGINGKLRSSRGQQVSPRAQEITDYIDQASFPEEMVLRRGVKGDFANAILQSIEEGTIFVDHGFVSMSTGTGFQGEMKMHITVPKGSKAVPVSHLGGNVAESEILAQRGSRFRVDKINGNDVHVTLLPPKEKK